MRKEFVMRGQTASGETEVLNFGKYKQGYAYRLVEFELYPSLAIGTNHAELAATITAAKTLEDPSNPNFNNEGLIATALLTQYSSPANPGNQYSVVNDTFLINLEIPFFIQTIPMYGIKAGLLLLTNQGFY